MKNKILILAVSITSLFGLKANAQTHVDVGVGTSNQDRGLLNLAVRKQFSEKIRAGIELQSSSVKYRFIGAKVIDEGIAATLSIPAAFRLYEFQKLRLDFYSRVGLRYQSVDNSFATENKLEDNTSLGFIFEPGLQISIVVSEKLNIQSGITLPNLFEFNPEFIYENITTNLFAGLGYKVAEKSILMLKANAGPAAGASGDSQKFNWGVQAGIRFSLGKAQNASALRLDPTF